MRGIARGYPYLLLHNKHNSLCTCVDFTSCNKAMVSCTTNYVFIYASYKKIDEQEAQVETTGIFHQIAWLFLVVRTTSTWEVGKFIK